MITVCLKAGLEHTAWTVFSHLAIWGTMVLWFLFLIAYSHVYPTLPLGPEMVGMVRVLVAAACQLPLEAHTRVIDRPRLFAKILFTNLFL